MKVGFSFRKLILDLSLVISLFRLARHRKYCCIHAVEEAAFPAAILCRRLDLPLVYDMQSSLPEQMSKLPFFRLSLIQSALRSAERWILMRADVIGCSLGLQSHIKAIIPSAFVQEWWFPGQQFPVYAHQVTRIRQQVGLRAGSRVVLYCGTFEPYQGLEELVKALPKVMERIPGTIFLLVGDNEDNPYTLTDDEHRLQDAGHLRVLPRQPSELIPSFYALADVLVSPRANGANIPLKVFDYMTSGKPIVASDIPAHKEVLGENRAALVSPTATGLAEAIIELLSDEEKAVRLGEAAMTYSERNLGWSRFSSGVKTLYDRAFEESEDDVGL